MKENLGMIPSAKRGLFMCNAILPCWIHSYSEVWLYLSFFVHLITTKMIWSCSQLMSRGFSSSVESFPEFDIGLFKFYQFWIKLWTWPVLVGVCVCVCVYASVCECARVPLRLDRSLLFLLIVTVCEHVYRKQTWGVHVCRCVSGMYVCVCVCVCVRVCVWVCRCANLRLRLLGKKMATHRHVRDLFKKIWDGRNDGLTVSVRQIQI